MRELNFVRDQKVHDAWHHVQWNFMEDVEDSRGGSYKPLSQWHLAD